MNPGGARRSQAFRVTARESGRLRWMPKTLNFRAVQKQTAASRSARPSMREQQGLVTGDPPKIPITLSRLAHMPNFKASFGQVA
ncbi:unnamed protein product [Coffea canephora]|uniref:Uncharacterized protein n=1 Tax=Coffea canephora TaxID=49390 RepID=A0A068V5U0_COFCA|nr:unnamed protein product [Coffea canephora]